MAKVWFVGTGNGDPELLTLKAHKLIGQADAILYASNSVAAQLLQNARPACEIKDAKAMSLEQISAWLVAQTKKYDCVVHLQAGDPSLYATLSEMILPLDSIGIEVEVVPGILIATSAAALANESLTLPDVTQTVIFNQITADMPAGECLAELAQHHCTLCLDFSFSLFDNVQQDLFASGWDDDAAVLLAYRNKHSGTLQIMRGTLIDIKEKSALNEIEPVTLIISPSLGTKEWHVNA